MINDIKIRIILFREHHPLIWIIMLTLIVLEKTFPDIIHVEGVHFVPSPPRIFRTSKYTTGVTELKLYSGEFVVLEFWRVLFSICPMTMVPGVR